MKKTRVILFAALICLSLLAIFLIFNAHTISAINTTIPTSYGQIQDIGNNVPTNPGDTAEIGKAYLKQEWTKILEKHPFGKLLLTISGFLTFLDFYWVPILGIPYSFSWEFLFGIAILIILTTIFYEATSMLFNRKGLALAAGFVIASLVGISGVINKALNLLTFAVKNVWIAGVSLIVAVLIMFVIVQLSGGLKKWYRKQKEEHEKEKTKEAEKVIQTHGKISKKELEGYS